MKIYKKVLLSLSGFSIASLLILLYYFLIYIFLGNPSYIIEIEQLKNITILLKEFSTLGISISISILIFLILNDVIDKSKYSQPTKNVMSVLLIYGLALFQMIITRIFLNDLPRFNTAILILYLLVFCSIALINVVKDVFDVWIINKKIQKQK